MNKGRKFLSDLKLYSDFLGWKDDKGRYETWEEATKEVFDTHRVKYSDQIQKHPKLSTEIDFAEEMYREKNYLTSQRILQFRGDDLFKHNFKLYNCLVMFADKPSFLGNAFYLMLCGCGVGVNMMLPFLNHLPKIQRRTKGTKTYSIQDSIEGWGDAAHVLITSYLSSDPIEGFEEYQGYEIKFDYSLIRTRGARVCGKFKAPGSEGIRQSFNKIETLMDTYVEDQPKQFKGILAYDFFMHLANAVLSGGIRRAACNIIVSPEDNDLVYAKTGNWREGNSQRERSNNSVGLIRNKFSKEQFQHLLELNDGISDIGFVFMNHIFELFNPCFEIGFTPLHFDWSDQKIVDRVLESDETLLDEEGFITGIQCCNLVEINGSQMKNKEIFLETVKAATIAGTLQAGYTDFKHIKDILPETIAISEKEALLGVSITGWANQPWLFNKEVLIEGADVIKSTNGEIAKMLGLNPAARSGTVKPSGNSSVILGCASGIHFEHSSEYFRVMQLNKDTETAKWLEENYPFMLEEGVYSETKSDYAVFIPVKNNKGTLYKNDVKGVKHLELIKLVKEYWVDASKNEEHCIIPTTSHNVSNTVIIDDLEKINNYVFEHQNTFAAVSFLSEFGDKDWNQSPNTSILSFEDIVEKYGKGAIFASGLIVDGLNYFNGNLWEACDHILNRNKPIIGTREQVLLKKNWIQSGKRFAKNHMKRDIQKMIYCLKDVHLLHKWEEINRKFKPVDFSEILTEPNYVELDTMGSSACSGPDGCEIDRI
tara:strand:- start:480 stop:2777 length:2298 start_codon:yes stop_codon:yes gene_type:complete